MTRKRIVFFGTPDFAVPSLQALHDAGFDVAAVVTATDKPAGRGHKLLPSAVKQKALELGIPVLQPEKLRDPGFIEALRQLEADLFVVIAFRMLPEVVWDMPRLGTFNIHGSLLPAYRGAAPINHAIINGETQTGITAFRLTHEIDTGDIIAYRSTPIGPEETVGDIHDRLMMMSADLTVETANLLFDGTATFTPQQAIIDQYGLTPSPAPKIFKNDCRVDWTKPAIEVHNFIRGLAPYPAAITPMSVNGAEPVDVKLLSSQIGYRRQPEAAPGTIEQYVELPFGSESSVTEPKIGITCGDGVQVIISLLQIPGKRPVTPLDIRNGHITLQSPKK